MMENLTAADAARLRAELRRRKILQRGDERMSRIFGRSQDEDSAPESSTTVNNELRDKQLIDQVIKDRESPVKEQIEVATHDDSNVFSISPGSSDPLDTKEDHPSSFQHHQTSKLKKQPTIDPAMFDTIERRQSLKPQSPASCLQIWLLHLLHFYSTKSHLLMQALIKFSMAIFSSYYNLNIVAPFLISHLTCLVYLEFSGVIEMNKAKFVFRFVKGILSEFFTFAWAYIIVQAFKLSST